MIDGNFTEVREGGDTGYTALKQCTMYLTLHSFILKLCTATIYLKHSAVGEAGMTLEAWWQAPRFLILSISAGTRLAQCAVKSYTGLAIKDGEA